MKTSHARATFMALLFSTALAGCSAGNAAQSLPSSDSALVVTSAIPRVNLGHAASFAVLAGSTVTSAGPTNVSGDLGIAPGTAITGFPPATLHGTMHLGGPIAKQAQADLTAAYNNAMGRMGPFVTVSGNLGGLRLKPGLYKSTSSLAVSSGDLTLDAAGNSGAIWIFDMASTFTMTTSRKVVLVNGARPGNVFWAIGSSATLGAGAIVYGNLIAHESISLGTGAVVRGRALARAGAVTLQSNKIVRPLN
jgi:hypothetical protein